ncbi:uncharacterized protein AMSG_07506 [Thecamonas trahens ATCC 50062]|uniref:Ras GTPase-activating protein n=1 Tax=Thecamonas trahens ATCC 50062 TaxID=461836 RepID=A0A0L0DJW3_THETB|nr:hypothetical protein AMSG_07506 [Thecamonas trahens ATCC 50062]KNC51598.1 hypothetical protein AMSG_07506 [Thecamonas trahens ATCC 50062]|eukprot:XP_013755996.1 hypothetical protein AMSG_07506 [Thecamonas trahens ATCC 50062]
MALSRASDNVVEVFDRLSAFVAGGLNHSNELQSLLRERQAIEVKYYKALGKLYATHKTSSRDRPLSAAWVSTLKELKKNAAVHNELADGLGALASALAGTTTEFEKQSRTFVGEGSKSIKSLQSAYNAVKKAAGGADSTQAELADAVQAYKRAQANHKAKDKEVTKLERKVSNLEEKLSDSKLVLAEKEKASRTQQTMLLGLLDIFQETSNVFNRSFRAQYAELALSLERAAQSGYSLAHQMRTDIENINSRQELTSFVVEMADESDAASRVSVMSLVNPTVKGRLMLKESGEHASKFKEYFCVFMASQSRLYWFAHEAASEPVGSLLIPSGEDVVGALHASLYARPYALMVCGGETTLHLCAPSQHNYTAWLRALREATMGPSAREKLDRDGGFATSLEVTVGELKGLTKSGEYYSLLGFGDRVVARTSKTETTNKPLWGDKFAFEELPAGSSSLSIKVFKDKHTTKGDKFRGWASVELASIRPNTMTEAWYPFTAAASGEEVGRLRLKIKHTVLIVRPQDHYAALFQAIDADPARMVAFCEMVPAALRQVTAGHLLHVYHARGQVVPFLHKLIHHEISNTNDPGIIFRGNSLTTKALDHFMKMVGMEYLHATLGPVIADIYACKVSCEVDASLTPESNVRKAWKTLNGFISDAWNAIVHSADSCPAGMVSIFNAISRACASKWPEPEHANVRYIAVSGFLFLRFFVPAILTPKVFDFSSEQPSKTSARTLTLVAKTIQNLGNLVQFGKKEAFMADANPFIVENIEAFKTFIDSVSSLLANPSLVKVHVDADPIGQHAAALADLLVQHLDRLDESPLTQPIAAVFRSAPLSEPFLPDGIVLPPPPEGGPGVDDEALPPPPAGPPPPDSPEVLPPPPSCPPPPTSPPTSPPSLTIDAAASPAASGASPPERPPPLSPASAMMATAAPPPERPKRASTMPATAQPPVIRGRSTMPSGDAQSQSAVLAAELSQPRRGGGGAVTLARGVKPPKLPKPAAARPRRQSLSGALASSGDAGLPLPSPLEPPSSHAAPRRPPELKPPSTADL